MEPRCSFVVIKITNKYSSTQHSLNKPFEGGLGSFMLYVLLGRYLESVADMINPNQNAGVALLDFLRAFGMAGLWPKERRL